MNAPFVRNPYNYDMMEVSDETGLKCADVTLAVQDQRDEVDINTIVRRFGLTGQLPEDVRAPTFGDFVGVSDYHTAMNAVAQANEAFELMPADIRYRFNNDPGEFVAFCSNDANRAEAEKLGLVLPKPPQAASAPAGDAGASPAT